MNCRETESLLLAKRDGVLTKDQHAALASHVAGCSACRHLQVVLAETAQAIKTEAHAVVLPNIEAEWNAVRAQISGRASQTTEHSQARKRPLAPVIWFAAPLAAVAAIAIAFINPSASSDSTMQVAKAGTSESTDTASTMVYVDKESGWLVVWANNDKG